MNSISHPKFSEQQLEQKFLVSGYIYQSGDSDFRFIEKKI